MELTMMSIEHVDTESVSCGIDIVSIERIETMLNEFNTSFKRRVFVPMEQRYCEQQTDPPQHYAVRWAVKEAFHKAIDPESPPVPFRSVAVDRSDTQPTLKARGPAETALAVTAKNEADSSPSIGTAVSLSYDRHADQAIGQIVLSWPS